MKEIIIVNLINEGRNYYTAPATTLDEAYSLVYLGINTDAKNFTADSYKFDEFMHIWVKDKKRTKEINEKLVEKLFEDHVLVRTL